MKVVITMINDKIIVVYQKPGKKPELKKIVNTVIEFEQLLGRKI